MNNVINYNDKDYFIYSVNADMSHTYGNIMAIVFNHIKSKFPKNFFKTEHVSKQVAIKQFQNINTIMDLKQLKPIIAIQPKLNTERVEYCFDYVNRTYQTEIFKILDPEYPNDGFFKDLDRDLFIYHAIERTSFDYSVTIALPTEYQQYNLFTYMRNRIRFEHPYNFPLYMEVPIPEAILIQLSKDAGIPIKDENGSIYKFLKYLNTVSSIPVVCKFQTSNGVNRFFLLMRNVPILGFTDLDMDDGNKDGKVEDSYEITFRVRCEFNYPSCFFYINRNSETKIEAPENSLDALDGDLNCDFTYTFNCIHVDEKLGDSTLLVNADFKFDKKGDNVVKFGSLLRDINIEILEYLKYKGDEYLNIILYENDAKIPRDRIHISWEKCELTIDNYDIDKSYKILIYEENTITNEYVVRNHKYGSERM